MAKKSDELDIPEFLRCPFTPEAKARLEMVRAEYSSGPKIKLAENSGPRRDFLQPKGMSDEDWAAYKERTKVVKKEATPKTAKTAKTSRPSREGLVSIGQIAKDLGMIPREARGVLRAIKMAKPSCGWAWPVAEVDAVKKAITEGKGNAPKKEGRKKAAKKPTIPPPSETTWSSGKNGRRKWRKGDEKKAEAENAKAAVAEKAAKAKAATAKKVAKIIGKKTPVKKK